MGVFRGRRAGVLFALIALLGGGPASEPCAAQAAAGPTTPPAGPSLAAAVDASFYCDNLEYENVYSVGRTYFGAWASLGLVYAGPAFDLSLGALVQRDFGDEEEVSRALPVFRFRYRTPGMQVLFGRLHAGNNHGLPEALLARQYPYRYPVEEGLQFLARHENLQADLWINWYLLNTPAHREFFAAGFYSQASRSFLTADLGLRVSHHGGQLYEVAEVSDNLSGMFRLLLSFSWPALDAEFGASGTLLGSLDEPDRERSWREKRGYGVEGECFFSPRGWKLYYRCFAGEDFRVEQGDPLYRTEKPLHRFGLLKTFRLAEQVAARLQGEGVVIESALEYNYAFVVDLSLDLLLHRFQAAAGGELTPGPAGDPPDLDARPR